MSFAVVCAVCLLQAQYAGMPGSERFQRDLMAWQAQHLADTAKSPSATREAKYEEQQFVNKFNNLLNTLHEFAEQYNHHVVDLKKVKALKKAWREMEKTDEWFRLDEKTGR